MHCEAHCSRAGALRSSLVAEVATTSSLVAGPVLFRFIGRLLGYGFAFHRSSGGGGSLRLLHLQSPCPLAFFPFL